MINGVLGDATRSYRERDFPGSIQAVIRTVNPLARQFDRGLEVLSEEYNRFLRSGDCLTLRRPRQYTVCSLGFVLVLSTVVGQRSVGVSETPTATDTKELQPGQRSEPKGEATSVEGLIHLDVTVTDHSGNAVSGLPSSDFKLLDNGEPEQMVAFRATDGNSAASEDSLSAIVFIDTLELPAYQADLERQRMVQYLRYKQLKQPVTIYSLEDSGFFLTANASTDGSALASAIISDQKVEAYFLAPKVHSPLKPAVDAPFDTAPAMTGLRALSTICAQQVKRPGRKLLFWIGPVQG
jgi:hypothetical protein